MQNILKTIGKKADELGVQCYVVGGYVRDQLLKRESKDLDFVVVGIKGVDFAREVVKLWPEGEFFVFDEFDTATILVNDYKLEFVGARAESYTENSRKPEVVQATLESDLSRRDFTVNAMAMNVNSAAFGMIVDLFHGQEDLKNKILKTPLDPDQTFSDDPLRIMRAIRFASQLNFTIEEKTLAAIDRNVPRLKIISAERIRDEVQKILLSPEPSVGLWLLFNTGILKFILPELDSMYGVEVIEEQHHKNILTHTFKVVDGLRSKTDDLALLWASLLHDIGKAQTKRFDDKAGWTFYNHEFVGEKIAKRICKKFALSNELIEDVLLYIRWHMQPVNLSMASSEITDSALRRLAVNVQDKLDNLFLLCSADITSKNEKNVKTRTAKLEVIHKRVLEVLENDKLRAFQSPVRGEEIMDICGLSEGRAVGVIKKAIEEAILDGVIPNEYDAAKEYLLKNKDELLEKKQDTRNKKFKNNN